MVGYRYPTFSPDFLACGMQYIKHRHHCEFDDKSWVVRELLRSLACCRLQCTTAATSKRAIFPPEAAPQQYRWRTINHQRSNLTPHLPYTSTLTSCGHRHIQWPYQAAPYLIGCRPSTPASRVSRSMCRSWY